MVAIRRKPVCLILLMAFLVLGGAIAGEASGHVAKSRYLAYERHIPGKKLTSSERRLLKAVRRWAQENKRQLRYDPRLGKVARVLASETRDGTTALNHQVVTQIAHQHGITDGQLAHVITQGESGNASLATLLRELKHSLANVDLTHLGVAVVKRAGVETSVLVLSRRLIRLSPIRSFAGLGQTAYVRGRAFQQKKLAASFKPEVAVTMPNGKVVKHALQLVDGKFQLPLLVGDNPGVMQVQILVNRGRGPEVAALFPIGVGHSPWSDPDNLKAPLVSTAAPEPALAALVLGARKAQGLNLPAHSSLLAEVARSHARDMRKHRFFAHVSSRTGDVTHRLSQFQISYVVALENIASAKSPDDIMQEWMLSPSHRANILSPGITTFGVGISEDPVQPGDALLAVLILVKQEETADAKTLRNLTRKRLNQERERHGLSAFDRDKKLDALALAHSRKIAKAQSRNGARPWVEDVEQWVINQAGRPDSALGIYHSTTVDVVMQAEHLLASFARVGIGIVKDPTSTAAPMWITLMWAAK